MNLKKEIKNAIKEYQCSGCSVGSDTSCYKKSDNSIACGNHYSGTAVSSIGKIFLGMPTGFNRLGTELGSKLNMSIEIFESVEKAKVSDWDYDMFNIPVWKYLDKNNNTLVRGLSPRTNRPFLHIFLENFAMNEIKCLEITQEQINNMD